MCPFPGHQTAFQMAPFQPKPSLKLSNLAWLQQTQEYTLTTWSKTFSQPRFPPSSRFIGGAFLLHEETEHSMGTGEPDHDGQLLILPEVFKEQSVSSERASQDFLQRFTCQCTEQPDRLQSAAPWCEWASWKLPVYWANDPCCVIGHCKPPPAWWSSPAGYWTFGERKTLLKARAVT